MRDLTMRDAAVFYEDLSLRSSAAAVHAAPPSHAAAAPTNAARERARAMQASDIFGHSIDSRGHWSVGPRVPDRSAVAPAEPPKAVGARR